MSWKRENRRVSWKGEQTGELEGEQTGELEERTDE